MSRSSTHSGTLVLLAASFLAVALGSIHAFSVLVPSLENHFDAPRALVSATYSLALGSLTVAVLFGHRVFACFSASRFVLLICAVAALGALIAATAPSLPIVWLGYSLFFGGANGLGYSFGLHIASQANEGREGTSIGIVTAAYALGATASPFFFAQAITFGGGTSCDVRIGRCTDFCFPNLRQLAAYFKGGFEIRRPSNVTSKPATWRSYIVMGGIRIRCSCWVDDNRACCWHSECSGVRGRNMDRSCIDRRLWLGRQLNRRSVG